MTDASDLPPIAVPVPLSTVSVQGVLTALDNEAAAHDGDAHLTLGPALLDATRSTLLRTAYRVDTGPHRLADHPWRDLLLVHNATGRAARVERIVSWQGGELLVESVEVDPALSEPLLTGNPHLAADTWYVVARPGRGDWRRSQRGELASLPDPGHARFVLTGSIDARQTRLLAGDPSLLRCALAAAALELLADGRRVLVLSADPLALDEIAQVVLQLHDAEAAAAHAPGPPSPGTGPVPPGGSVLAPGTVIRVGPAASVRIAADHRLTLDGAIDRLAASALAELSDIAAELRHVAGASPAETAPPTTPGGMARLAGAVPSGVAPADQAARPPTPNLPTQPAPSAGELAEARAVHSEAIAVRVAAEADARIAADAHGLARQRLRALDQGREGHRRIDDLARQLEVAAAESAASAAGVGRLADAIRRAGPAEQERLVRQLLVAAEVAADRMARRDEIIVDFDADRDRARSLGVARSEIERAEAAAEQTRDAHAAAEAVAQRALAAELTARDRVNELAGARLRGLQLVPSGEGAPTLDGREALQRLRARYLDATVRRRHAGPTAVDLARVVLVTPHQLGVIAELAGARFDHLLVEQANLVDAASLCLAAARIERSVVLGIDVDQRPSTTAATDADTIRWLASPITELLGLVGADGLLVEHPAVLALG